MGRTWGVVGARAIFLKRFESRSAIKLCPVPSTVDELGRFRHQIAGIVKDVIKVRWIDGATPERWGPKAWIMNELPEKRARNHHLTSALTNFRRVSENLMLSSASLEEDEPETLEEIAQSVVDHLLEFIDERTLEFFGSPGFDGSTGAWSELCNWSVLPELRRLLDRLPVLARNRREPVQLPFQLDSQGRLWKGSTPVPLLRHQLRFLKEIVRGGGSASERQIVLAVWGGDTPSDSEIAGVKKRINQWLGSTDIGWKIIKSGEWYRLVQSSSGCPE